MLEVRHLGQVTDDFTERGETCKKKQYSQWKYDLNWSLKKPVELG
jgi:hypothetical protein